MKKATKEVLLHDGHLVLGMVLVMVAIVVIVRFPVRSGGQVTSPAPVVADTQPAAVAVPFTEIARGVKSRVATRTNYIITSPDQMKKLWDMVDAKGAVPAVDFTTEAVIAVFAGADSTSSIAVAKIEDAAARMVSITISRPEEACLAKLSTTTPYELIKVPVTTLPLTHEDISTTVSCP